MPLETLQGHFSSEHVDDISQITIRQAEHEAVRIAIAQGIRLAEGMEERQLTISDKSVVVRNCHAAARRVAKLITMAGYPLQAVRQAEDLGITTTAGGVRAVQSSTKR